MKYLRLSLILLIFISPGPLCAQAVKLDSLNALLEQISRDTTRVNLLNELADETFRSNPTEAIRYGSEAKELAEQLSYRRGLALAYKYIGLGYYMQSDYEETLRNWESSLRLYEMLGDDRGVANILSNRGALFYTKGNYNVALEDYLRALPYAERAGDSARIGTLELNLGSIYSEQISTLDSAQVYYHRGLAIGESIGRFDLINYALINLGELYLNQGNLDSSLYYFKKSLTVVSGNIDMSLSYTYLGRIYGEKGEFEAALQYHREAIKLASEEGAQFETARALIGMGSTYERQQQFQLAIEQYAKAEELAKEVGLREELSEAYNGLSSAYAGIKDYRNAFKYLSLRNEFDNATLREEAETNLNLSFFTYELNKKQDEIESLEQLSQIEQLKTRRQRAITIATGSLGLLILLMAVGFYNRMQFIRRTNEKIREQRDEIESQRNELEKARDQIQAQHDMVYEQKELITDSISYAERIQSALLPSTSCMDELTRDYFVLFKPKDIVSGDFYWVKQVQDHLVIVSADCTGHGVPGAFMSMLGITLLNDLIGERCYDAPSAILESLRMKIKDMLVQEGNADEQKDGMDMAIAVLDTKNRELHYAGANNPLYIIRGKKSSDDLEALTHSVHENGEFSLFEVKPDKQPIGVHWEETAFRNHSIPLKEHDSIYLFSDGYIDQFGGEHRKKFKSLNFKKLLLSIQAESMKRQKEILEQTFDSWRGDLEQIDDVSVIGIQI